MERNARSAVPKMMGLREAATASGVSYSCIRRWIQSGVFSGFVRSGNRYLVNMDRLADFLNGSAGTECVNKNFTIDIWED